MQDNMVGHDGDAGGKEAGPAWSVAAAAWDIRVCYTALTRKNTA